MKSLPSSLNNILRARYLQEAVDTSAPTYKRKEEDITYPPRFVPELPSSTPELTMPPASEFPSPEITKPKTSSKISEVIKRALQGYPTSPEYFGDPDEPLSQKRRLETSYEKTREIESRNRQRQRGSYGSRPEMRVSFGIPTVSDEHISRAAQATKSGMQKTMAGAEKFNKYAMEKAPNLWGSVKGAPYQAAHLGLGYYPFVAGAAATDIESLPDDPILGLDPVSFAGGMAAAEMATPYMVDLPLALARGAGVASGLKTAGQAALSGLGRLPYFAIPYGMAYGTYQLQDWSNRQNEPRIRQMMRDYEIEQAKLETKRRKEGREESYGEALGRTMQLNDILQSYGGPGHWARPF